MEAKSIEIEVGEKGKFVATTSPDPAFPGIDIEFYPKNDDCEENLSLPGVRMEFNEKGELRILVWANKDSEDYSQIIIPNHKI